MNTVPYLPKIPNSHLQYRELGEGPTLVLVPGLDGTAELFYRQIPLLSPHFHVLTFPLPNDSSCTMDSLVKHLADILKQVMKHRGHEKILLCGESFGGALSLSYALSYPEHLHGLIILNSFPKIRTETRLKLAPWLLKITPWGAMGLVRRFTESRLHSPHALPEDLKQFHQCMKHIGKAGYIRRLEILQSYDLSAQLENISTPTLFLAGDLDRLIPSVQEATFMARQMPQATVKILKGYGHICMINHDFDLFEITSSWLKKFDLLGI